MIVAGAMGVAAAIEQTKLAEFLARSFVEAARPGGPYAIYAAAYFTTAFLSTFINNTAVIAICVPMIPTLAHPSNGVSN